MEVHLAEQLARVWLHNLSVVERVRLSLERLQRPAHYSLIAEAHNKLFPELAMFEKNIHAACSREECGVVWIGMRGTYALTDWGFERPSQGLYDIVVEIVQRAYQETQEPVTWNTIYSEVGQRRRVVNRNSVILATVLNPGIVEVSKGRFAPRPPESRCEEEPEQIELDKILRAFGSEGPEQSGRPGR